MKITKLLLLAILMGLFSCSDDFDDPTLPIDQIETANERLAQASAAGQVVKSVSRGSISNGYKIEFTDGSIIALSHKPSTINSTDGVTPIIKIDNDGYWAVSYDYGQNYQQITDSDGLPITAYKFAGFEETADNTTCYINVATDSYGYYSYEVSQTDSPSTIVETIETNLVTNPASLLSSVVRNEGEGTITITMADGNSFVFAFEVPYPTGIEVAEDTISINAMEGAAITFRFVPADAFIHVNESGNYKNIFIDVVEKIGTRSDISLNEPTGIELSNIEPTGEEGQFTATVSSLNNGDDMAGERVCLVVSTKTSDGGETYITSNSFNIYNGEGKEISRITLAGVEAEADADNPGYYYVKLPYTTDLHDLKPEFVTNSSRIYVKGVVDETNQLESVDFSAGAVTFVAVGPDGEKREYVVAVRFSNLPVMYVNTSAAITSKEVWVKGCNIQILNAGEMNYSYSDVQMKGRGNSTWSFAKKPYAIKLDKKQTVLGMPKHKRWCLIANYLDKTLMRNEIAYEIARRMEGLDWSPRGKFVDVVYNGKYNGNYYLCEQIKIDSNRVDITEMEVGDDEGDAVTGGYLLEFDKYYDEVNKFRSAKFNMPVNIKSPDENVFGDAQMNYISGYIANIETLLTTSSVYDFDQVGELIDYDSYIDWWLVNELALNVEPAHPKSSYMYKDRNGKLFAGPAWDYDYATFSANWGDKWLTRGYIWYGYLFRNPDFVALVKERWANMRADLQTIPEYIDQIAAEIKESAEINNQYWPYTSNVNLEAGLTLDEAVAKMRSIYVHRFNWIDQNINKL